MIRNPTARLFVAVDPPIEVREQLATWARGTAQAGGYGRKTATLRILDPELLHVTLCFLGNRPVEEIDMLGARLLACDGAPGKLSLGAPLWLPERSPRALAVELHDDRGRLASLQVEVLTALQEVSGWQPNGGKRTNAADSMSLHNFRPHITVARLRQGSAPQERVLEPTPSLSFVPEELVLYRSWLSPEGASYEAVCSRRIG